MLFLGLTLTDWTAIAAFGTLLLACATFCAVIITVRTANEDRRRDDARRKEDQDRDDRLRHEAIDAAVAHERAERTAREDFEARQVVVLARSKPDGGFTDLITVSTPRAYPITKVEGGLAQKGNHGWGIRLFRDAVDPYQDDTKTYFSFRGNINVTSPELPVIRFTDWHGNLYYVFRGYTERFDIEQTNWRDAINDMQERIGLLRIIA
jgi:hypothetical protein